MAQVIDWHRVETLRAEIGPGSFADVVALFLDEAEEVMQRLATATDPEGDLHCLKGAALSLGFAQLADLCQPGPADLPRLSAVYRQSRAAFLAGLGQICAA